MALERIEHVEHPNFWQDLPATFQNNVVKELDYKSRCCLRKCSKVSRSIVDRCPLNMTYIILKTNRICNPKTKVVEEHVVFSVLAETWKCINLRGIENFLSLFKNRRSIAQSVWFDYFDDGKSCVQEFIDHLTQEISKRGSLCRIRARKIQWNNVGIEIDNSKSASTKLDPGIHFLRILYCFDSKFLKSLDIVRSNFTGSTIKLLAKSRYWWLLKEINIEIKQTAMIDLFLTGEKLMYTAHSFSAHDIWEVVESFRTRNLPHRSFFYLSSLTEWDIECILNHFPTTPKPISISEIKNSPVAYTSQFKIGSGEHILLVTLTSSTVKGVVCRAKHLVEDYNNCLQ